MKINAYDDNDYLTKLTKDIKLRKSQINLDEKEKIYSMVDTKGKLIKANDYFAEISGWDLKELIGENHNLIRHPDMPKFVFRYLWKRLAKGDKVYAFVKNLAKSGSFYWVIGYYEPVLQGKEVIGYQSYRRYMSKDQIDFIEPIYTELLKIEKKEGMDSAFFEFLKILDENNVTYDELMVSKIENKGVLSKFGFLPKFK